MDKIDLEIKSRDESLKRRQEALNTAKNNKEYSTLLTEINVNKADNSKLENRLLEYMTAIENEEKDCLDIETQIAEQETKVEQVRLEADDKATNIEKSMSQIQTDWDKAADGIPADVLAIFRRLSDNYDGEALAYVDIAGTRRKVYTCNGCYMGLTSETVNRLMSDDDIIKCPSCSRIVILRDEEKE